MNKELFKAKKLLISLVSIILMGFILGLFFTAIISNENKKLIIESTNNIFEMINNNKFNYSQIFVNELFNNTIIYIIIWIIGISLFGIFFGGIILFIKSFLAGFSFTSIIYSFKFKGFILAIINFIPDVIYLFSLLFLVYYSISFSNLLFNYLFKKKEISRDILIKRYLKVLGISLGILFISIFIRNFIVPYIIGLF